MGLADHVAVMCAEPNANIDDIISIHPGFVLRYKKNVEELINHHQVKRERVLKKDWSPVKYNGTQFETSMIVGWLNANLGVDRAPKLVNSISTVMLTLERLLFSTNFKNIFIPS